MAMKYQMLREGMVSTAKGYVKSSTLIYQIASRYSRIAHQFSANIELLYNCLTQTAIVSPFALIYASPDKITHLSDADFETIPSLHQRYSPIVSGDWDRNKWPLREYDLYSSIVAHFEEDIPWERTDFYNRVQNNMESGDFGRKWGVTTLEEFKERISHLDELYTEMVTDRYKTQRELRYSNDDPIERHRSHRNSHFYPPELHEITVHIDRNGEMLLHDGRHRLAIAQAAGLERIPVRIMARHSSWQEVRERVAASRSVDQLEHNIRVQLHHPDLIALLSNET